MSVRTLEPVSALVESVEVSDDGLNWHIKLREDVNWHDGELFTAEDIVFSYNFLIDAGRPPNLAAIESIEANGDYALNITLSEPAPALRRSPAGHAPGAPSHHARARQPAPTALRLHVKQH